MLEELRMDVERNESTRNLSGKWKNEDHPPLSLASRLLDLYRDERSKTDGQSPVRPSERTDGYLSGQADTNVLNGARSASYSQSWTDGQIDEMYGHTETHGFTDGWSSGSLGIAEGVWDRQLSEDISLSGSCPTGDDGWVDGPTGARTDPDNRTARTDVLTVETAHQIPRKGRKILRVEVEADTVNRISLDYVYHVFQGDSLALHIGLQLLLQLSNFTSNDYPHIGALSPGRRDTAYSANRFYSEAIDILEVLKITDSHPNLPSTPSLHPIHSAHSAHSALSRQSSRLNIRYVNNKLTISTRRPHTEVLAPYLYGNFPISSSFLPSPASPASHPFCVSPASSSCYSSPLNRSGANSPKNMSGNYTPPNPSGTSTSFTQPNLYGTSFTQSNLYGTHTPPNVSGNSPSSYNHLLSGMDTFLTGSLRGSNTDPRGNEGDVSSVPIVSSRGSYAVGEDTSRGSYTGEGVGDGHRTREGSKSDVWRNGSGLGSGTGRYGDGGGGRGGVQGSGMGGEGERDVEFGVQGPSVMLCVVSGVARLLLSDVFIAERGERGERDEEEECEGLQKVEDLCSLFLTLSRTHGQADRSDNIQNLHNIHNIQNMQNVQNAQNAPSSHHIQALRLQQVFYSSTGRLRLALQICDEIARTYVQAIHGEELVRTYGEDGGVLALAWAAMG